VPGAVSTLVIPGVTEATARVALVAILNHRGISFSHSGFTGD
jgi:hypothetical protein